MSLYGSISANKTGPQVANYLQAIRSFVPEMTNAPDRSLTALGPEYANMCLDNYGRIASCQSVFQTGYAGGQIDANYIMLGPDMINRPNIEMKVGLTQPSTLSVLDNPSLVMSSGDVTSTPSLSLLTQNAKLNNLGQFTANSDSYAAKPTGGLGNNPFASAFAFASSNDVGKLQQIPSANTLMGLPGSGGGQRICGETPLVSSIPQQQQDWVFGTNYKDTPVSNVVTMGTGLQSIGDAYNKMFSSGSIGGSGYGKQ